ncbi:2Fe-2S iron-sulfur cluster-binding protein [Variovorax sp.]|jgi:ferredoxin-NADP reductase|uniref:2Fe-2S iron-sulfur cluster-binding protein n=1 Tax=Variovorax sp. TaxID=1871043 RepID=UPI0012154375|nr:2Fe-2S iron-sulfur cluster-binding protein [Variovorax sp.]TAJ60244.1 MAG: 2Fe-2S iron-sulfur cluster binding domain-containing protein [Variovorax sp.]
MPDTIDPAIAADWLAIGDSLGLAPGTGRRARLLGHDLHVRRQPDGALEAWFEAEPTRPCHATDHCGFILLCLGDAPKPLFELAAFANPARRFLYMGGFGIHSGPLRVVENFLDMAHFPFVHAHILGSEEATEVRGYEVELDARQELWARDCKFIQPLASADAKGGADVDYVYRVVNPFSPMLYKHPAGRSAELADIIFLFIQPTDEERCIAHFAISLFDAESSSGEIMAFQQNILGQDKPILENHVHKKLPLDPRIEVPSRADAASSTFRRWLRDIHLRWGIEAQSTEPRPRLSVEVAGKRTVAQDIVEFRLRSPRRGPLPSATAGSHLDVHLPNGQIRQYSVCGQDDEGYTIAVKREADSRGGSIALHESVQAGMQLEIGLPKNNFRLDPRIEHAVLIAGGIGITPILAMARDLAARGKRPALHYFCRSAEHAAYRAELEALLGANLHLHLGLSPQQTEDRMRQALQAGGDAHAFACGPAPLMQCIERVATELHWPAERVHFEYFRRTTPVEATGPAFTVELARSGRRVQVASDTTIVEALRAIDIHLDTSCEQGVCGTCLCTVIEGEPDHRDQYLSAGEKASGMQMLPCVSRSRSATLVLDL